MTKIYWELTDFEFKFSNFFVGIFLDLFALFLAKKIISELKDKAKLSLDNLPFYCIICSVI